MSTEEIRALFPLKGKVTSSMLDANRADPTNCIGAKALRAVLPMELHSSITWICTTGGLWVEKCPIRITTKEQVDIMLLEEPIDITFVLLDQN